MIKSIAAAGLALAFAAGSAQAAPPSLGADAATAPGAEAGTNVVPVYGGCGWGYAPRWTPWGYQCVYVGAPAPVYPAYPGYYRPYYPRYAYGPGYGYHRGYSHGGHYHGGLIVRTPGVRVGVRW